MAVPMTLFFFLVCFSAGYSYSNDHYEREDLAEIHAFGQRHPEEPEEVKRDVGHRHPEEPEEVKRDVSNRHHGHPEEPEEVKRKVSHRHHGHPEEPEEVKRRVGQRHPEEPEEVKRRERISKRAEKRMHAWIKKMVGQRDPEPEEVKKTAACDWTPFGCCPGTTVIQDEMGDNCKRNLEEVRELEDERDIEESKKREDKRVLEWINEIAEERDPEPEFVKKRAAGCHFQSSLHPQTCKLFSSSCNDKTPVGNSVRKYCPHTCGRC